MRRTPTPSPTWAVEPKLYDMHPVDHAVDIVLVRLCICMQLQRAACILAHWHMCVRPATARRLEHTQYYSRPCTTESLASAWRPDHMASRRTTHREKQTSVRRRCYHPTARYADRVVVVVVVVKLSHHVTQCARTGKSKINKKEGFEKASHRR